jgi:hypothetical protein
MDDSQVIGDEPLADGMRIAVRIRRDFVVTDVERFLAAARRAYVQVTPSATDADAAAMVTGAADAVFAFLEQAGMIGADLDARLASAESDGLALGGQRAQVTLDDPWPLPVGPDCVERDVFALPAPGESPP